MKALEKIYYIIDFHWAEVCAFLPSIEALSEDKDFKGCEIAAAIASKCYYHLQEYNDALRLALASGNYFDVSLNNEYIETLLSKCIDEYKALRVRQYIDKEDSIAIDSRMESILERMFQRCYKDQAFDQALGVALDTYRLDKVEEIIQQSILQNKETFLNYAFSLCQSARNITPREFRLNVIRILVQYYGKLASPDVTNVVFGLQYLNQPQEASVQLLQLIQSSNEEDHLLAYQIAFDLLETENQGFILQIVSNLPAVELESQSANAVPTTPSTPLSATEILATQSQSLNPFQERLLQLKRILLEGFDIELVLYFLFKHSHSDLTQLNQFKQAIEGRSNVLHNATILSHAYLNAGTTKDNFLRDNLDWIGRAKNWAKFTTVATIGVIHKGHIHESMNLLQPYLPQHGQSASAYSEAGALYALGLIHANKGGNGDSRIINYLKEALINGGTNEVVQHGACLGIGLAAMATGDEGLFETMRGVLFNDSAVASEGAAYGIGLLMLGQAQSPLAQQVLGELLTFLHDTTHEKCTRGLSLAIAMMFYGQEENADVTIDTLIRDRDPIVRYGAMFTIALAYCGTGDNKYIRQCLHVAVSDVNDDVRRAAVMVIGFLTFRNPENVPKLVSLLAESFNPHVRYGACLAVGIGCAGTALKEAIELLIPMLEDNIDFVRQGAMLAMSMVLQQTSETRTPFLKKFKEQINTIVNDKHQPILAKTGAILASGIIDAGGGNVVISMLSRAGFLKMGSVVGLVMFLQHWYWYPLFPFLSLSFTPTMVMGLNKQFDLPNTFDMTCNAPPSMFSYSKIEEKKEEDKKMVTTAVLSTTAKAKVREARKEAKKLGKQMSFDEAVPLERVTSHLSTTSYLSVEEKAGEAGKQPPVAPKKAKEPTSFTITNPSRLIPSQQRFVQVQAEQRYVPIRKTLIPNGIVMLKDTTPDQPQEVTKIEKIILGQEEDVQVFEPFEWDPNEE